MQILRTKVGYLRSIKIHQTFSMIFFKQLVWGIFFMALMPIGRNALFANSQSTINTPIIISSKSNVVAFDDKLYSKHFYTNYPTTKSASALAQVPGLRNYFVTQTEKDKNIQWLQFSLFITDSQPIALTVSVAFSDICELYAVGNSKKVTIVKSGDRLRMQDRAIKAGQIAFLPLQIMPNDTLHCLLKITNVSAISKQFSSLSLQSVKLYAPAAYKETFEQPRTYQSFFYGAIAIMILFNFFIFITTRSISYLFYVLFLLSLAVFLASNNGFLLEIIFPNHPTVDLYFRFLSAPLLIISYLIFSQHYLQSKLYAPKLSPVISAIVLSFFLLMVAMFLGFWYWSRLAVIGLSVFSFFIIFWVSIQAIRKGYSPAKFFLAGNALLLLGGVAFSIQRIYAVVHNPATQYSIQIAALLEIVLFSLGLADRINVTQRELNTSKILQERAEKEAEMERKKIIEEKNIALQKSNQELDAFIYKTAHDIRGPLARLMGLCSIAQLDVKDTTALEYFDKLNANANNLNFILGRLTKVYEISSLQLQPQPIDFTHLVYETIKSLTFYEGFDKTKFNIQISENLTFVNDERLVRFVLINLIENAIKFQTSEGVNHEVIIEISKFGNAVNLTVSDNGLGIKEEDQATIFDIFSKAADQYQTPGLGLYMTKIGLGKIGGQISLSNFKLPTQFLVNIPGL